MSQFWPLLDNCFTSPWCGRMLWEFAYLVGALSVTPKQPIWLADSLSAVPERDVERSHKRFFHLHCSCGTTVETSEKTATCTNCGKALNVSQNARKHRKHWSIAPPLGREERQRVGAILVISLLFVGALLLLAGAEWTVIIVFLILPALVPRVHTAQPPLDSCAYEKRLLRLMLLILLAVLSRAVLLYTRVPSARP